MSSRRRGPPCPTPSSTACWPPRRRTRNGTVSRRPGSVPGHMAVDPYVPTRPEDAPRRSVAIPAAAGWRAVRPGDLDPAAGPGGEGVLFGTPGPDGGYALTLTARFRSRI